MNFKLRNSIGILVLLAVGLLGSYDWISNYFIASRLNAPSHSSSLQGSVNVLDPHHPITAPHFVLPDAQGKKWDMRDYNQKVHLIHFWATWCAPCLEEIPKVLEFAKRYETKNLPIFMVSEDESFNEVNALLIKITGAPDLQSALPKNIVSLLDLEKKIPGHYGTYQYPETYLINDKNQIVAKWVGPQNWDGEYFDGFLKKLLGP